MLKGTEMNKRSGILILTVLAVAAVFYLKTLQPRRIASTAPVEVQTKKSTIYLFHNPKDQDDECRKIYAFADQAEKELYGSVIVRRPDIEREPALLDRYSVHVLPTILILSPDGKEQARFQGEGDTVAEALKKALEKLKHQ